MLSYGSKSVCTLGCMLTHLLYPQVLNKIDTCALSVHLFEDNLTRNPYTCIYVYLYIYIQYIYIYICIHVHVLVPEFGASEVG